MNPDIVIEVYEGKKKFGGRQSWRWRAVRGGNNRKMANGGEAYANQQDCFDAIETLFGSETSVHLRHPSGQSVVRQGVPLVLCIKCGHNIVLHMNTDDGCTCGCQRRWVEAS